MVLRWPRIGTCGAPGLNTTIFLFQQDGTNSFDSQVDKGTSNSVALAKDNFAQIDLFDSETDDDEPTGTSVCVVAGGQFVELLCSA
eukprot:m.3609 g.3609  ORF g.3609 m.3609 type:complete len:86 (+) comp2926_c0_seq1:250-507(+)